MEILSYLGDLLSILIRAAILIIAYITLALDIFDTLMFFATMLIVSLALSLISGTLPTIGFYFIEFELLEKKIRYEAWIEWEYHEYFDMSTPKLVSELTINGKTFEEFFDVDTEESGETSSSTKYISDTDGELKSTTENTILNSLNLPENKKESNSETQILSINTLKTSDDYQVKKVEDKILQNPTYKPSHGYEKDKFTFEVTYKNDIAPVDDIVLELTFPNKTHYIEILMNPKDPSNTNYEDGVVYYAEIILNISGKYELEMYINNTDIDTSGNNDPIVYSFWLEFAQRFEKGLITPVLIVPVIPFAIHGEASVKQSSQRFIIIVLAAITGITMVASYNAPAILAGFATCYLISALILFYTARRIEDNRGKDDKGQNTTWKKDEYAKAEKYAKRADNFFKVVEGLSIIKTLFSDEQGSIVELFLGLLSGTIGLYYDITQVTLLMSYKYQAMKGKDEKFKKSGYKYAKDWKDKFNHYGFLLLYTSFLLYGYAILSYTLTINVNKFGHGVLTCSNPSLEETGD